MPDSETTSLRSQLEALLPFTSEKARSFETEISIGGPSPLLRRIAAANLFRLPRCLRAILLLADANLSLEANTICRTVLELAIQSCWMGTDEERASLIWNKFVRDQQLGMMRLGKFTKTMGPVTQAQQDQVYGIPMPRRLSVCADESIDGDEFPARQLARALYDLHYDPLSTGAHGDLRDAVTIVQWRAEAQMITKGLDVALFASVTLLCGTSLQLGFANEVKAFLRANGIASAFSS
jgi:hypothetical protein